MSPGGTEIIIGAVQHDQFGPAVMVGAGGILADLLADHSFRLAPLSGQDAGRMLDELRTPDCWTAIAAPNASPENG